MSSPADRLPKRGPGRPKGSLNKATVAWKKFVTDLCDDPRVQRAAKKSILEGKTELLFRAAEHAHGKPRETVDLSVKGQLYLMPDGEDIEGLDDGSETA